jgi:O-antigen/teichoic acid export membrane protein
MILRSLASLAIRVGGAATAFGFQVLLARLLGPAHLGVYHTANAVSQLVSVIGRRGLDNLLVKRASVAHGAGRIGETRAIASAVLGVIVRNTAVLAVLMIALAVLAGQHWLDHEDAVPALVLFGLAALPLSLVAIHGESLKSIGLPLWSAAVLGVAVPLLNLTAILALGAWVASAASAAWLYLGSTLVAAAVAALVWRAAAAGLQGGAGHCDLAQLKLEARPFFVAAVASMVAGSADILVLSVLGRPEEVGIYAVASRIAMLFLLVSVGINGVIAPRLAQIAAQGDTLALRRLSIRACLLTAGVGLPLLLAALLLPGWVLGLFGPDFTQGAWLLQLVVAGRYVSLVSGPLGHLFQMAGRAGIERDLLVGAAVVLVGLAIPLTLLHGAVGTATASCVAWAGLGVARVAMAAQLLRVAR